MSDRPTTCDWNELLADDAAIDQMAASLWDRYLDSRLRGCDGLVLAHREEARDLIKDLVLVVAQEAKSVS